MEMLRSLELASIKIEGAREPEIVIELNQEKLRQYQLTAHQVQSIIAQSVKDLPAGKVETQNGQVLIKTLGRKDTPNQFNELVIVRDSIGNSISLGEIATIKQDFYGQKSPFYINSKPGLVVNVFQTKTSNPIEVSNEIQAFIEEYQNQLPETLSLTVLQDASNGFKQRISMLTSNGIIGMFLVILMLSIFLDLRLAFWVSMGVPIAIIGAIGLMPMLNIPINMVTLFAFVLTLGILVDDAVIVAENIYQKVDEGIDITTAIKKGVSEMALPVILAVITNIIAFIPLLFVPGQLGVMYKPMTLLIFAIFIVSLIEALLILPNHLRNISKKMRETPIIKAQQYCIKALEYFKQTYYANWLNFSLKRPLLVVTCFILFASIMFSWAYSGRIDASFVPKIESTRIDAEVEFPSGSSLQDKVRILTHIEKSGIKAINSVGGKNSYDYRTFDISAMSGSSTFMIVPDNERQFTARKFVDAWRNEIGAMPGIKSLFFDYQVGPGGGKEVVIELGHANNKVLSEASKELMNSLQRITGLTDIGSSANDTELQYSVNPNFLGQQLGFTSENLGIQIRTLFFGEEVTRQISNGDELKVRVLLDRNRHYLANDLEHMIIVAPNGDKVELGQVADITSENIATSINRVDGMLFVEVTASILRQQVNGASLFDLLESDVLPKLNQIYPNLDIDLGGDARIESKVNTDVFQGVLLAIFLLFAILSIVLRSYLQAIIVLLVIPFCLAASILGHIIMGHSFSVMSLFGMIALSGIVINGSLVLMLKMKSLVQGGRELNNAIFEAAISRFRPVTLTALTTSIGLIPMLFETSTQALYLIPMVISLSFGSLFSIITILLLSPALNKLLMR